METVPTATEKLWHEGANYAADAVTISQQGSLLLIRRPTGEWALPGGFIDPDESSHDAAQRELYEETGLVITGHGTIIYSGVVDDPRNSPQRWIESDAYLFDDAIELDVVGQDDATEARWWKIDDLPTQLYGSHGEIIKQALLYWQRLKIYQLLCEVARGSGV